jgi:hypothetical protein
MLVLILSCPNIVLVKRFMWSTKYFGSDVRIYFLFSFVEGRKVVVEPSNLLSRLNRGCCGRILRSCSSLKRGMDGTSRDRKLEMPG